MTHLTAPYSRSRGIAALGALRQLSTGATLTLRATSSIGRSASGLIVLGMPQISAFHAMIRWEGSAWVLHDLDSRNGTWLNGRRLARGAVEVLAVGARLSLGEPEPTWELVDDRPPQAVAVAVEGGLVRTGQGQLLSLPDEDEPQVLIHWHPDGWRIEREGHTMPIADGDVVEVGGVGWRLSLPEILAPTLARPDAVRVSDLALHFRVSADEEQVWIQAEYSMGCLNLGTRTHHYLLLTLARARLEDRAAGLLADEEGWLDTGILARRLRMTLNSFYVQVSRARAHLAGLGVQDAVQLLERRGTRRMRLGVAALTITRALDADEVPSP